MGNSSYVSLSLATALERSLSLSAHNLANASTAGYKSVHPLFETRKSEVSDGMPISFVQDSGSYLDHSQGALFRTDNPLDIALSGDGWLGFETTAGNRAYGRFGQLIVDTNGQITTTTGQQILDVDGAPIELPVESGQNISIALDGTITNIEGEILGQIGVFKVENPAALTPLGRGLYAAGEAAAEISTEAEVVQGFLEASNVEPVLEMTRLIDIQRAYESSINLMEEAHSLTKQAIQRLGQRS